MDTLLVVNDKLYDNRHSYKSESEKKEVSEAIYKTLRRLNDYEEYFRFFYPRMIQEDLPKLINQKLVDLGNEYFSFIVKKERCSRCGSPNYS
ncbi:MAG: hypothetical protein VX777_07690 [Chlamydiota bacterium]|nr:hypothetical protein [Chlamydiota bacterium]